MTMKQKIILCLAAIILAAGMVSIVSADTNSLLEFFGFGKPTQTPTPTLESNVQSKTQSTPAPDKDPFAGIDPALVESDESEITSKSSDSWFTDDWEDDPFANSTSSSHFDQTPSSSEQKDANNQLNNKSFTNSPNQRKESATPMPLYRFPNNPVFRPISYLPCTGFPTNKTVEIKSSITYAQTNMRLSIPTLKIEEDIVIVPLVDDNFPVENLGSNIGLLEGSGATGDDLFVLAGHNHLNTQEKGPFATLSAMKESDLIFVRGANDASRTFVVYANEKFAENDIEGLLSYARPGCMILITCEDESIEGGYLNRRVIFAEAKED